MRGRAIPLLIVAGCSSHASPPPPIAGPGDSDIPSIPVGFDAFRAWDQWPRLRIGTRTYMRSTYDRAGANEGADASHFLRVTADRATALDVLGTGVLAFERYNHWHGSPWHYVVDGTDRTVKETNTAHPDSPSPGSSFLPSAPFPEPLAWTWSTTEGADLVSVPVPFERSLRLDYERTHYGTGYFVYQLFPQGARNLSAPLASWDASSPPPDVLDLVASAGQDIAPTTHVSALAGVASLPAGEAVTLFDAGDRPRSGPSCSRSRRPTPRPSAPRASGSRGTIARRRRSTRRWRSSSAPGRSSTERRASSSSRRSR
jgi:hypothetical protein